MTYFQMLLTQRKEAHTESTDAGEFQRNTLFIDLLKICPGVGRKAFWVESSSMLLIACLTRDNWKLAD